MAKPIRTPRLKAPQATFPVPPFVSQAEVVNLLRLRSQLHALRMELDTVEADVLAKLDANATVENGPYTCARINAQLAVWEDTAFAGGGWRREKAEVMR